MITELHARGLAVLDSVSLSLGPGFNVLSGETGAGKTLIVGCLSLLSGARATGRHRGTEVEAVVVPNAATMEICARAGIDCEGELIVSRSVGADGRSRARVGGQLVPVGLLAEVMATIVEIHGQGGAFALSDPGVQLDALDDYADAAQLRAEVARLHAAVSAARARLEEAESGSASRERRIDYLRFITSELSAARESVENYDKTLASAKLLRNSAALGEQIAEASGAIGQHTVSDAAKRIARAASIDPSLEATVARLEALAIELDDISTELAGRLGELEFQAQGLGEIEEELAATGALLRKYGPGSAEALETLDTALAELAELESDTSDPTALRETVATAEEAYNRSAAALSKVRRRAAKQLAATVSSELKALSLGGASFNITISEASPGATGHDRVRFMFSSDPSLPEAALADAASGGELSRLMIAVKLALAGSNAVTTLVFDEADAGVGGTSALDLAKRIALLGAESQVIAVTHLPQVAAYADTHFVIRRSGAEAGVDAVSGEERVLEISRMLAGLGDSRSAQEHAAELLAQGSKVHA